MATQKNIPLFKPTLGKEELKALAEIFKTGWVGLGPKVAKFEEEFAKFVGTKYAVGLNSCTAALHLALYIYDFPKGSEVLLPSINFISGAHVTLLCGLKPVMVDVEPDTLVMDIKDLEKKITSKTVAVIPVHMGGHPVDMDPLMEIAKKKNLVVIEDVANAQGGTYKGKMLGSIGHIGCFSFEAKKNMTTGDGGMLTLNNEKQYETFKRLRWLGINKDTWKRFSSKTGSYSWYYEISELGFKYNMNDIAASIGLVQLKKLPGMIAKKDKLIARYNKELGKIPEVKIPVKRDWGKFAYWLYIIQTDKRDELIDYLQQQGITTGVHSMPTQLHPLYANLKAKTPVADEVWKKIITLPLYPSMTPAEQNRVIGSIQKFFKIK